MCVHVCTLFRERTCSDLAIYIYISFWLLYQTEFLCFMLSSIKISLDIPLNEERLMGKQKKHKPEMIQTSDLLKAICHVRLYTVCFQKISIPPSKMAIWFVSLHSPRISSLDSCFPFPNLAIICRHLVTPRILQ